MENPTREELEQMLEKAKREAQAMLDKMSPEERARAEAAAKERIAADQASMQKLIDDAAAVLAGCAPKSAPRFCGNCGAAAEGGKFCAYCGMPL